MRKTRPWLIAIACLGVMVALWVALEPNEPAPEQVATPTEVSEPAAVLANEPASAAPEIAPEAERPSAPGAKLPQPSAATPMTTDAPASTFQNTPRKRAAEPMRLHFAHTPQTPTPGIGLSKAACAELRERQQRAESLSDRELLHLHIDCRGR